MASLTSIVQSVYNQLNPKPGDESAITKEDLLSTARGEYAYIMQLAYWNEKKMEGTAELPSYLLTPKTMDVVNNEIDISGLNVFRTFGADMFIQNIGGLTCECDYVRTTVNKAQLLKDFEPIDNNVRPYILLEQKIIFPKGTHTKNLPIIYANKGEKVDNQIYISDDVASMVREKLVAIYLGKTPKEDVTNNTNSGQ